MAGRKRMHRDPDTFRDFYDDPRLVMHQGPGPGPLPLHPAAMEEELKIQQRDMQRIIAQNRSMIDDNTFLQRELEAARDEIYRLSQVIPKVRADKELQAMELIERGLKLEDEVHAVEPLRAEVMQLRDEAQKLNSSREDLSVQVQGLKKDITRLQSENQQIKIMKSDVDAMRKERDETRRIIEYERKSKAEQLEQKEAMENNLVSMAREIEKLRAEQMNNERNSWGHGEKGYGVLNRSHDMRYSGGAFGDNYSGAWGPYDKREPPRR